MTDHVEHVPTRREREMQARIAELAEVSSWWQEDKARVAELEAELAAMTSARDWTRATALEQAERLAAVIALCDRTLSRPGIIPEFELAEEVRAAATRETE